MPQVYKVMITKDDVERSGLSLSFSTDEAWERVVHTGLGGIGAGPTLASLIRGWGKGAMRDYKIRKCWCTYF